MGAERTLARAISSAVLAAAPMFTGLYAYTLGFAAMLAALVALQYGSTLALRDRSRPLTLGFSPLAFCFLGLILLRGHARATLDHPAGDRVVGLVVGTGTGRGFELAGAVLFPTPGTYPFNPIDLLAVIRDLDSPAPCLPGAAAATA